MTRFPLPRPRPSIVPLAACLAAWLGLAALTRAADPPAVSLAEAEVRVGFGGYFEVGRWAEVAVEFDTPVPAKTRLVVRAPDPDANVVAYHGPWSSGESTVLTANFASGRLDLPIEIALETPETPNGETRTIARTDARTVRQNVRLIATIGGPAGFAEYVDAPPRSATATGPGGWRVVELESASDLPADLRGFEGLDVLVVADGYDLPVDRLALIERWVWNGGHLIVATGENRETYRASPLAAADWLPVTVAEGPIRLAKLDALQVFARERAIIPMLRPAVGARLEIDANRTDEVGVLAAVFGDPILVRSVHGFGYVTFLGVELHQPPLSEWNGGIETFVRQLVEVQHETAKRGRSSEDRRLARTGINDLGTQFNAVQEDFPEIERSSRWTVMGLVLLYIAIIGPLDYLFVHRVLRRPEWTWATLPAVAIAATVLGLASAAGSNGDELHANRFELVDLDAETGWLRGLELLTVYSPENRRYEVTAEAAAVPVLQPTSDESAAPATVPAEPSPATVNWFGLPEDAYGGMYRTGGLKLGGLGYSEVEEGNGFANVPIPVWSTKPFRANWTQDVGPAVRSHLVDEGFGRLVGEIEYDLGIEVHEWMLVYGNRMYRPRADPDGKRPPLKTGERVRFGDASIEPRDLRHFLTRTESRVIEGNTSVESRVEVKETSYDSLDRNPRRLVEILSFHEIAGGRNYTGLENALLDREDLSNLVLGGRAVLLGRVDLPLCRVSVNGAPVTSGRQSTFLRIVLSVEK